MTKFLGKAEVEERLMRMRVVVKWQSADGNKMGRQEGGGEHGGEEATGLKSKSEARRRQALKEK